MKNETARREIESLDYYLQNHTDDYSEESHTAMMMGIKALEQEPCGDAISRQWLMKCVNEGWIKFDTEKDKNRFIHLVRDMAPPVTPQPKYEDIAKAFQLGLAFGFGENHDEMNKVIEEIKKVVTPHSKIGYWIKTSSGFKCSKCLIVHSHTSLFCPSCGAKMIEPQERSDKE